MIWNSIPIMTTVDVLIIAVTVYAIWSCRLIGPSKRPSDILSGFLFALETAQGAKFYAGEWVD